MAWHRIASHLGLSAQIGVGVWGGGSSSVWVLPYRTGIVCQPVSDGEMTAGVS